MTLPSALMRCEYLEAKNLTSFGRPLWNTFYHNENIDDTVSLASIKLVQGSTSTTYKRLVYKGIQNHSDLKAMERKNLELSCLAALIARAPLQLYDQMKDSIRTRWQIHDHLSVHFKRQRSGERQLSFGAYLSGRIGCDLAISIHTRDHAEDGSLSSGYRRTWSWRERRSGSRF
jgi:hypothetical protein